MSRANEAAEAVAEAAELAYQRDQQRRRKPGPPPDRAPLDPLERHILMCQKQLDHYEATLNAGLELSEKQEKRMLTIMEVIRKHETTRHQLLKNSQDGKKSDPQLAKEMVLSGIPKREVLDLYPGNTAVREALKDL